MNAANTQDLIDVQALRVGMYVHLDIGWMSHPFPVSSFKLTSADQIATIAGLGLAKVRWSPQQSDVLPPVAAEVPVAPKVVELVVDTPESRRRDAQQRRAAEERAALALCERQFAEATRACKAATERVVAKPAEARAQIEALSRALVDKMLVEGDLCVRLLTEGAGDRASQHSLNVSVISLLMARTFHLSEGDMLDLGVGALMHDIGKIDLPDRVRHRDEQFNSAEMRFYEEHVAHGLSHARRMGLSPGAMLVVAQHHEHADGSGFPLKLGTDRMTAAARIVALIDRYDNLCNPPHPAKALTPHEALSMLFAQGKTKFDTAILGAFIKMMGVYPPGSTVQLTDDRYAMVVTVNSSRPLKPCVVVHDPSLGSVQPVMIDLQEHPAVGIRRSLKPNQLPAPTLACLSPRPRVSYFFEPARLVEAVA